MASDGGFFYDGNGMDTVEDADTYGPGGYYAAILGDVLPKISASRAPRYRLLQKLGHGAFATVWLARDLRGGFGYVAVKINVSRITGKNNEINILRWLREDRKSHANDRNIIHLLDDFLVQGPNGTHECLVTEVVAGMGDLRHSSAFRARAKEISYQTMLGLSYLHERGVAHGDLHMRNLAISLPQLNEHSEDAMMSRLGYPDCVPVIARNPAEQSISFPAYITSPVSLVDYLTEAKSPVIVEPLCVKIMDFGNSFRERGNRPPPNTPISIRAPEVTFSELSGGKVGSDWDRATDIWAAACTLYELNFGQVMLYGMGKGDSIIYRTFELAGPCPQHWQQYWDLNTFCKKYGDSTVIDPEVFWSKRRSYRGLDSEQDTDQLIDLLRKMLRIDPKERPPIKDLLAHPWFSDFHCNKS